MEKLTRLPLAPEVVISEKLFLGNRLTSPGQASITYTFGGVRKKRGKGNGRKNEEVRKENEEKIVGLSGNRNRSRKNGFIGTASGPGGNCLFKAKHVHVRGTWRVLGEE